MSEDARKFLTRRWFVKTFGVVAGSFMAFGITGCRDSDTLYNDVYTDWSDEIDYDTDMKNMVNRPDSPATTNLPQIYETESELFEEEYELPEYDEETNDDEEVEEEITDENSHNSTTASSSTVEGSSGTVGAGTGGTADGDLGSGDGDGDGSGEGEGDDSDEDGDEDGDDLDAVSVGGNQQGQNPLENDATSKPSSYGPVIAFGEIANLVMLLSQTGGDGLWACDDTFYEAAQTQFASSFNPSAIRHGYWSKYSSSMNTMSTKKFNKLCAAIEAADTPPVYVIYDAQVGCPLTEDQVATLEETYGIQTQYHAVNQKSYLKSTMGYMYVMFKHLATEKEMKARYQAYWTWHDNLLDEIKTSIGGIAAWSGETKSNIYYDQNTTSTVSGSKKLSTSDTKWTVIVDDWDESASYDYNGVKSTVGIGITRLGYTWSPASYYLQLGGVINNSAAYKQCDGTQSSALRNYVWQFHPKMGLPKGSNGSNFSLSGDDQIGAHGTDNLLDLMLLAKNMEYGAGNLAEPTNFPAVIVRNQDYAERMEKCCKSGNIYACYYMEANATSNNNGYATTGLLQKDTTNALWRSYVGFAGDSVDVSSKYKSTDAPFEILVNPHGLYSSWLDGGVESVLEAAWAAESFGLGSLSTSYGVNSKQIVSEFYSTFYGQAPSSANLTKILDGSFAE